MGHPLMTLATALGLVVGMLTAIAQAQTSDPLAAMAVVRPATPTPAPDFAFRGLDGQELRLHAFRGKPVLLKFFTTW